MKGILIIVLSLLLSSCFFGGDPESDVVRIEEDFWLTSSVTEYNYCLLWTTEPKVGGVIIVNNKVDDIASNDEFIIVKQIPNRKTPIEFEIYAPEDTCYLTKNDSIYFKNEKWYHSNNEWNYPDSLKNKNIDGKLYFIIDIRKYNGSKKSFKTYSFDNEHEFYSKLESLNPLNKIDF